VLLTRIERTDPGRLTRPIPRTLLGVVSSLLFYFGVALFAQADTQEDPEDRAFFSLPMELDLDSGADNGDAAILRLTPLYKIPLTENWSLVNLEMLVLADAPGGVPGRPGNPEPEKGDKTFGLADFTHVSFLTPENTGDFSYGFGFMATLPIATDDVLGSDKWSAGPSFRLVYRTGPWSLGMLGGNQWSYAGDGKRGDINQLMLRGAFRRQLDNNWYLVSAPIITANWDADSGKRWMVPLGGGIGKVFSSGSNDWALSLQAYANAIKPDGAPDWVVRFAIAAPIPESIFR
jgi:hypothetical protein